MKLVDSHAHLYLEQFDEDVDLVIERAQESGVSAIYMPNIDSTSIDRMLKLEERYPGYCIPMMGLHPCSVKKDFEKELYIVEEWLAKRPFVAIGEIGTDLYWDDPFWSEQKEAFNIQVDLAKRYNIPVVIHCRESIDQTIALVSDKFDEKLSGVFHCFAGSSQQAKKIINLNMKIGIGGVSTFKNGGLHDVIPDIDLKDMILETDCPYLSPVPYRGKRNEPFYLSEIAARVSELKATSIEEVAEITSENTKQLFASK